MTSIIDFTQYNEDEIQDPIAVESGEYKIRLIDMGDGVRENSAGNPYILPRFEVCDEPIAKDFSNYMALPVDGMDAKALQRNLASLKNFCKAFGITFEQLYAHIQANDFNDMLGLEAWAILGQKDDPEYGPQNYIKKWVVGA